MESHRTQGGPADVAAVVHHRRKVHALAADVADRLAGNRVAYGNTATRTFLPLAADITLQLHEARLLYYALWDLPDPGHRPRPPIMIHNDYLL